MALCRAAAPGCTNKVRRMTNTNGKVMAMSLRASAWELVGTVALIGAFAFLVASTSFFYADDFLYGSLFGESGFDRALLLRSYFGHLVPGFVVLDWNFYKFAGMSWPIASLIVSASLAGLALALTRLLDATVGLRRINLIGGAGAALSLALLPLVLWWGAAITNLIPLALGISFLGCVTRWIRTGRRRYLLSAVLMYALALSFYEKSLLFSAYAVFWTVLVVDSGVPFAERLRRLVRRWPLWAAVFCLSAIVLGLYLLGAYREESGATATPWELLEFVIRGVGLGLIPSLFGLDLQSPTWGEWVGPLAVTTFAAVLSFVWWSTRRTKTVLGAWIFGALAVILGQVPVAIGRASISGADGGRLLRYQIEGVVFVIVVAVMVAVAVSESRPTRARDISMRARVGGGMIVVVIVAMWSISMAQTIRSNPGAAAKGWMASLDFSWPDESPVRLIDSPMPDSFLYSWQYPFNMASVAVPLLKDDVVITTDPAGAWMVSGTRGIVPFEFLEETSAATITCAPPGGEATAPLPSAVIGPGYLKIAYESEASGALLVSTGAGEEWVDPAGIDQVFSAHEGQGELVAFVREGTRVELVRVVALDSGICLTEIAYGQLANS